MAKREPAALPNDVTQAIRRIYVQLASRYGPQHWWPADSPAGVAIGAILTQNTAWKNVERAIANLTKARCLNWPHLHALPESELAVLIRPAGTYRIKARRLKAFADVMFAEFDGSLDAMLSGPLEPARERLLAIHGIGPETADAILLYAGNRASFVVDAYTKRILRRHHLLVGGDGYETVRRLFQESLVPDRRTYNEYHALIVRLGKEHCRAKAACEDCPLADMPHDAEL